MRSLPLHRLGGALAHVGSLACVVAVLGLGACEPPIKPGRVKLVELSAPTLVVRPGSSIALTAVAFDLRGEVVDAPVTWQSSNTQRATVDADGVVLALTPGLVLIQATIENIQASVELQLVNPPPVEFGITEDSIDVALPNGMRVLTLTVNDSVGDPIVGAPLQWSSSLTRIAEVSATGVVTARAAGVSVVRVELEGFSDSVIVAAVVSGGTGPNISDVSSGTIEPGVPVTISGTGFDASATNTVVVDGLPMTVTASTRSSIAAVLPVGAPCLPSDTVMLQVTTTSGVAVWPVLLQTAPQRSLGVGEAAVLSSAEAAACNEIILDGGTYLLTISHTARALGAGTVSASLTGRVPRDATVASAVASAVVSDATVSAAPAPGRWRVADARAGARLRAHREVFEASARIATGVTPAPRRREASLQIPPINGIVSMRVPNVDDTNFCTNFHTIGARTVYVGPTIAILEDTASQFNGQPTLAQSMDGMLALMAAEIESITWPMMSRFGNPLVADASLDDNDRVVILLTPKLNAMRNGELSGLTVVCDFYQRGQFPSSNVGEVVYLPVPTNPDPGFAPGTKDRWRFEMRGTIAHEMKHIVSLAERTIRGQPLEEFWLEEGTARIAEELFAREIYGLDQREDAEYEATIRCELRELGAPVGCPDAPRLMRPHLDGLWDFLDAPSARSPLGSTFPTDASYYGSAWSLVRWAVDQSNQTEPDILRALTLSGQRGVTNLEGRLGLPWDVMVPLWSLAMITDGTPASVVSPQITMPGWDLANIFGAMCHALTTCDGSAAGSRYSREHPARPAARSVGSFAVTTGPIQPGSFSAFRLDGTVSTGRQVLEVRGASGGIAPTVRLAILRIE